MNDVIGALEPPGHALRALPGGGDARAARAFYADGASIAFALHCYVDCDAPTDQGSSRLRPLQVHIDPRHEPARVRTALEHVYAEDPTADGASAKSAGGSAAAS